MGREACVRLLIAAGADVNHVNRHGLTPFTLALYTGHRLVLKILLRAGADVVIAIRGLPILRNEDNSECWTLVDAIRKVGGWQNYVDSRASLVRKATKNKLPHAVNLMITAFVEPTGGF